MSDVNKNTNLFEIPAETAKAMKESLQQLDSLEEVQDKLIAVGIMDKKSMEQIGNLKKLTQSIFDNFKIAGQ